MSLNILACLHKILIISVKSNSSIPIVTLDFMAIGMAEEIL